MKNKSKITTEIEKLSDQLTQLKLERDFLKFMLSGGSSYEKIDTEKQMKTPLDGYNSCVESESSTDNVSMNLLRFIRGDGDICIGSLLPYE